MRITIACQNLSHGGYRVNDTAGDRWPALIERLGGAEPDLLIVNEATGWETPNPDSDDTANPWPVASAHADRLGLAVAGVAPSRSGNAVALLYRKDTIGPPRLWDDKHAPLTYHGFGVAAFDIPGWPKPLAVAAAHLSPFAREQALAEVQTIVCRLYRWSPFALVGGDFNFPPLHGRRPDWARMLPHNRMLRLRWPRLPYSPPWRGLARRLHQGGFTDTAWHLYRHGGPSLRGNRRLLAWTGITERVDWIACSRPLRRALVDAQVLDTPAGASDHDGVLAVIDTDRCDLTDPFDYL